MIIKQAIRKLISILFILGIGTISLWSGYIDLKNNLHSLKLINTELDIDEGYENLASYFYSLNPKLYENVRKIRLKESTFMLSLARFFIRLGNGRGVGGWAIYYLNEIHLSNNSQFSLAHEICHFLEIDLTNEEKRLWFREYKKGNYYREYSSQDWHEDFADYCGLYIYYNIPYKTENLKIFPESFNNFEEDAQLFWDKASMRKNILDNFFLRKNITYIYTWET